MYVTELEKLNSNKVSDITIISLFRKEVHILRSFSSFKAAKHIEIIIIGSNYLLLFSVGNGLLD